MELEAVELEAACEGEGVMRMPAKHFDRLSSMLPHLVKILPMPWNSSARDPPRPLTAWTTGTT